MKLVQYLRNLFKKKKKMAPIKPWDKYPALKFKTTEGVIDWGGTAVSSGSNGTWQYSTGPAVSNTELFELTRRQAALEQMVRDLTQNISYVNNRIVTVEHENKMMRDKIRAYEDRMKATVSSILQILSEPVDGKQSLEKVETTIRDRFKDIVDNPDTEYFRKTWDAAYLLVSAFFNDKKKTEAWFNTDNPMLGNISPRDMIRVGRGDKLLHFIKTSLDENQLS